MTRPASGADPRESPGAADWCSWRQSGWDQLVADLGLAMGSGRAELADSTGGQPLPRDRTPVHDLSRGYCSDGAVGSVLARAWPRVK